MHVSDPSHPLPKRSMSQKSMNPPYDATKSDGPAIDDIHQEVQRTGSLERAARRLSHQGHTKSSSGSVSSLRSVKERAGEDGQGFGEGVDGLSMNQTEDPEEVDFQSGEVEEDEEDESDVVHLQEVIDGLWIGDLVAAMDTKGLEARGIVSCLLCRLSAR
jgi:dual specificity phosphatase 12